MRVDFTGKIVTDGKTVFAEVSGYYTRQKRGSLYEWFGELKIESDEQPFMFKGRLITNDGKEGDCFAKTVKFNSPTIQFVGSGPIG